MKTLVIIPTYNEADNIAELVKQIFALNLDLDILVVDDNSPDGTAEQVLKLQTGYPSLHLLKRDKKDGLGRAYLAGFTWAKERDYEAVIQMDADFSHSPAHLPDLLAALAAHNFVIGSRYVKNGGVVNWPLWRQTVSRGGSLYARIILGLPIKDLTGGFNAWTMTALDKINLTSVKANGYSFQIELKAKAARAGCNYQEVPIIFTERRLGQSKMRGQIVAEAVWRVWQLKFKFYSWRAALALAAIMAATVLVYWPSLNNQLLNWDDAMQVTANPDVKNLSLKTLGNIWSSFYVGMYQPLSSLTYAVEYKLFGPSPFAFHLIDLVLHLINIILVFCLFKILKTKNWLALSAAALFAVHPMNVEVVAWISATSTLCFSGWLLVASIAYFQYLQKNKRGYLWLSLSAFIIAVLYKSAGVIFPLIMLMALWLEKKPWRKAWPELSMVFVISGLFSWLTLFGRQSADHLVDFSHIYTLTDRLLFVGYAAGFYILKFFAPFNLSAFYVYPFKINGFPWFFYAAAPAMVIATVLIVYGYKKRHLSRLMIFACGWWLINLILVLKIIPVGNQITADRYNYLPMLGLILFTGLLLEKIPANKSLKIGGLILLALLIAGWSYLARQQTYLWRDNLTFFNTTISQAPREAGLYDLRGLSKRDLGDYPGALADLDLSVELDPINDMTHNDRSVVLAENFGRYNEAIKEISLAIALRPRFHLFYYNRGTFEAMNKNCAAALADFSKAIELEPHSKYFFNRGNCHFELKQYPAALADYDQALKLNPNFPLAYFNRALVLAATGQRDQACASARQAVALGLAQANNWLQTNCQTK